MFGLIDQKQYREFEEDWTKLVGRFYANELSPEWLADYQLEHLRRGLAHAKRGSAFYGERLRGVDPETLAIDSLASLPFTTKDDLRSVAKGILSGSPKQPGFFYETSGTTGTPTPCPRNMYDVIRNTISIRESLRPVTGLVKGEFRGAAIMGPSDLHSTGDSMGNSFLGLGFGVFKAWPFSPSVGLRRALEVVRDYEIDVLVTTSGTLQILKAGFAHFGIDIERDLSLQLLLVTGEYCSREMTRNLAGVWGRPVYDYMYGAQETSHVAAVCTEHHLHVLPLNHVFETVEPGGTRVLDPGETGELVVTMIQENSSKPLIRYRTGDIAVIRERHECGALRAPIVELKGRIKDATSLSGRRFLASEFEEEIMSRFARCAGYQIHVHTADGEDAVAIDLEFGGPAEEAGMRALEAGWAQRFGTRATARAVNILDPVVNLGSYISWKAARIDDTRAAPDAEAAVARGIVKMGLLDVR